MRDSGFDQKKTEPTVSHEWIRANFSTRNLEKKEGLCDPKALSL